MPAITPVLLCGGSGTRLWPLSRQAMPKQFARLLGKASLYQAALERLSGTGWRAPVVVTAEAYLSLARDQALASDSVPETLMVEPSPCNTAPAILAAALHIAADDPEALMLVAPSDHAIPDAAAFGAAVAAGAGPARAGQIVTFGIRPTRAETGYGWLELASGPGDYTPRPLPLSRFVEKPDRQKAEEMLSAGRYLWNAGIFLASARTLIEAFALHAPGLLAPVGSALAGGEHRDGAFFLDAAAWRGAESISIDYAVMERAANLCVVPFAAGWSDLGDWDAVWRETAPDADGMVATGSVTAIGCADSLLRCDTAGVELVGIGLTDTVVVAMADAILVAHRSRAQDVKEAVARLKAKGAPQAEAGRLPGAGCLETRVEDVRFAIRYVQITPGSEVQVPAAASRRTWTVLSGTARIHEPHGVSALAEGEAHVQPAGTAARLTNSGDQELVMIEALSEKAAAPATRRLAIAAE